VDFENVGKIDLAAIPAGVRVPFFFGASQKTGAGEPKFAGALGGESERRLRRADTAGR
jgi:hypothetical protein